MIALDLCQCRDAFAFFGAMWTRRLPRPQPCRTPLRCFWALLIAVSSLGDSPLTDKLDEFTDERKLYITLNTHDGTFSFGCAPPRVLAVLFSVDESRRTHTTIDPDAPVIGPIEVRIRYDDSPARIESWYFLEPAAEGGGALREHADDLLLEAVSARRMIATIGNSEILMFDMLNVRDDLTEFKRRCDEWLEASRTSEN